MQYTYKMRHVILAAVGAMMSVGLSTAYPKPAPYYPAHAMPQTGPGGEAVDDKAAAETYSAHEPPRSYHFQYAVHDPKTGDVKSQNEVGDGLGTVRGTYSLVEPDGSTRVVEYTADDEHGFQAEVKRIEPQHKGDDGGEQHYEQQQQHYEQQQQHYEQQQQHNEQQQQHNEQQQHQQEQDRGQLQQIDFAALEDVLRSISAAHALPVGQQQLLEHQ